MLLCRPFSSRRSRSAQSRPGTLCATAQTACCTCCSGCKRDLCARTRGFATTSRPSRRRCPMPTGALRSALPGCWLLTHPCGVQHGHPHAHAATSRIGSCADLSAERDGAVAFRAVAASRRPFTTYGLRQALVHCARRHAYDGCLSCSAARSHRPSRRSSFYLVCITVSCPGACGRAVRAAM